MSDREKAKSTNVLVTFYAKTSTVRGSRKVVKNMLNRTGLSDMVDDTPDTIMTTNVERENDGSQRY